MEIRRFPMMKMKGLELLIRALIVVESEGNDHAIGDRHLAQPAYGPLQIRQPVCDDYNRAHGTAYRAGNLIGNRRLSIRICRWYLNYHGRHLEQTQSRPVTTKDYVRIWNGGPNGVHKPATLKYWRKVERILVKERRKPCGQQRKSSYSQS